MKWELKTLNQLGFVGRGKSRHRPRNATHLYGGIYPLIQTGDIQKANFFLNNYSQTYSEEGLAQSKLWKEGTMVISIVGANTAETAILGFDACFPDSVIGFIPDKTKADVKFVKYNFECLKIHLKGISEGTARENLSLEKLLSVNIPTPPLPTQRKIASILSAYDDLLENNLKRIKLLEEQTFLKYKGIVRSENLEAFTIEDLANVVMGQSPKSDTYTDEKDNLPFHQGVTNFSNYFVAHKIYCKSPIKIAESGDILFSVRAPVGRINFTTDRICIGRGLCAFRSKKGFQNYLYHQLKEFFFAEDVIGNGAIFNAVTKVELMNVKLKTPNEKIQKEFEIEARQIYDLILNLTKQNAKLREARDILLPKLMNGQIAV